MKRAIAIASLVAFLAAGCSLPGGLRASIPWLRPPSQVVAPDPPIPPSPPAPPSPPPKVPVHVRGLYLTGYTAGSRQRVDDLLAFAKRADLNAMVIDAKDDDGRISFQTDIPLAREIGSNSEKIKDAPALLQELADQGIYTIARIVVFCDPLLSSKRPDLAILNAKWRDTRGLTWSDPLNQEVWKYNVDIAKAAAKAGFKEIQFDYVRFPERKLAATTLGLNQEKRVAAITDFLDYAKQELEPLNVFVSADVFGLTTTVEDDMMIGQDYAGIARAVDYISPMVYPSHYSSGNYGLKDPDSAPYETVFASIEKGKAKTPDLSTDHVRPWIQDFSLRHQYGKVEVEAQLRALAKAGVRQFMLWDPKNKYTRDVDFGVLNEDLAKQESTTTNPSDPATGQGGTGK
ncbi:MAG TPA: putative glycoside hydrolase [Bacillota bacterium]